jgi:phosphohistidine swiveling domain-containing protein
MTLTKETPSSGYGKAILSKASSEEILEEFGWFGASFYTGEPTLTLKKIESDRKERRSVYKSQFKTPKLDKRLRRCVEVGSEISFIRTNLAEVFSLVSYGYFAELKAVAKMHRVKLGDVMKMIPEEVVALVKNGQKPENIKTRKNEFGIVADKNGMRLIYGKELAAMTDKFSYLYKPSESLSEITGLSAFNGIAKGVARIVLEAKDIGKVQEGEIIVAPETTPDYILGMKKAAAFVTNQGGITSHAAIVAREMQKPCVIATKVATEVIRDGDLIEVNANQGIVKILKSS